MRKYILLLNIISYISISSAIILLLVIFYWYFYPYKPVIFQDKVFPIAVKTIKKGDLLFYTSNYCKYMELSAHVTRTFHNELLFVTPTTITNRPMGCNTINIGVLIPNELPAGEYKIENTYEFQVNPIRKVIIKEETEAFTVVE
jgi:hypothetical protein